MALTRSDWTIIHSSISKLFQLSMPMGVTISYRMHAINIIVSLMEAGPKDKFDIPLESTKLEQLNKNTYIYNIDKFGRQIHWIQRPKVIRFIKNSYISYNLKCSLIHQRRHLAGTLMRRITNNLLWLLTNIFLAVRPNAPSLAKTLS